MLDAGTIISAAVDHALGTGRFDEVNKHEPENSPGSGIACAIWPAFAEPAENQSSLINVTMKFVLNVRLYIPWSGPFDNVDTELIGALDALMTDYSGDFTFGGLIKNIDFFGSAGDKLRADFGYQTIDNSDYRVVTIKLPLIISDVWAEEE